MSRRLLVLLVLLLVVAVAAPAAAITKNYVPDPIHTYVGLIGFYSLDEGGNEVWSHRCSGELIAPTVVLTAGHCTDDGEGGVMQQARIWFQQDAGAGYTALNGEDPVTGYPNRCTPGTLGTDCAESHVMYNYGFDNFAGFPNTHDVGIVILEQSITGKGQAILPGVGVLDDLIKARGTKNAVFTVSGYGVSFSQTLGYLPYPITISYRVRLMAESKLVNLVSQWNDGFNIQLNGNGDGRGGTCSGDSGGPVFWPPDSNIIVAVTSFGHSNAGCRGDGYYYRLDRQEVLDWIAAHMS